MNGRIRLIAFVLLLDCFRPQYSLAVIGIPPALTVHSCPNSSNPTPWDPIFCSQTLSPFSQAELKAMVKADEQLKSVEENTKYALDYIGQNLPTILLGDDQIRRPPPPAAGNKRSP